MRSIHNLKLNKYNNSPFGVILHKHRTKLMNSPRWIVILAVLLISGVCFIASAHDVDAESVNLSVSNNDVVLELTVPSSVTLNLVPNEETSFGTTDLAIGVGTNNSAGYTLSMTAASDTLTRTSSITDSAGITYTPTILPMLTTANASGYTAEQFASSSTNDYTLNRWGYKLSSVNNYMPMTTDVIELASTDSAGNANTTTLNFAAKVDMTKPAGTYATTLSFVAVTNVIPVIYLYDTVAALARPGDDSSVDFSVVPSTANSGVYKYSGYQYSQNSLSTIRPQNVSSWDYDVYYYRGVLSENSSDVNFAPNYVRLDNDTCWIILRTTKTGGIKMLYNGKYGETTAGSCANNGSTVAVGSNYYSMIAQGSRYGEGGYDYDFAGMNYEWYENPSKGNMAGYTSLIEGDAGYCDDFARDGGTFDPTGYGDYYDIGVTNIYYRQSAPYLECTSETDLNTTSTSASGNKLLTYPVALVTADELVMAGATFNSASVAGIYIYSGVLMPTLTPYTDCRGNCPATDHAYMALSLSNTGFVATDTDNTSNAGRPRPTISLVHSVIIDSGSGSAADPWIISAP